MEYSLTVAPTATTGRLLLRPWATGDAPAIVAAYRDPARARGRGIAPLALDAICAWAFNLPRTPRLNRVELIHDTGNHASCRVAEKAGFGMSEVLPPAPPEFLHEGHLHVRIDQGS